MGNNSSGDRRRFRRSKCPPPEFYTEKEIALQRKQLSEIAQRRAADDERIREEQRAKELQQQLIDERLEKTTSGLTEMLRRPGSISPERNDHSQKGSPMARSPKVGSMALSEQTECSGVFTLLDDAKMADTASPPLSDTENDLERECRFLSYISKSLRDSPSFCKNLPKHTRSVSTGILTRPEGLQDPEVIFNNTQSMHTVSPRRSRGRYAGDILIGPQGRLDRTVSGYKSILHTDPVTKNEVCYVNRQKLRQKRLAEAQASGKLTPAERARILGYDDDYLGNTL